jgi:ABC-type molybdenum transport system ATPase subunit/photorepair protein PhrA
MVIEVKEKGFQPNLNIINRAYLVKDHWNDWWEFNTMFDLMYVDCNNSCTYIGSVKIAEVPMVEGQTRPNLPERFEHLSENFFSLGQSDFYYENLNRISVEVRSEILRALNDIALDAELFEKYKGEYVTRRSILRDISNTTVTRQFRRIAEGGARLTDYFFSYRASMNDKSLTDPMELTFQVVPESNPPSNIHVIIGRNGVGKTRLIKNIIKALINKEDTSEVGEFSENAKANKLFANIVCVAFSAFDEFSSISPLSSGEQNYCPYIYIGLPQMMLTANDIRVVDRIELLTKQFVESADICIHGAKYQLWEKAISVLESDPIFKEADIKNIKSFASDEFKDNTAKLFKRLSSGHKIILLTITKLVETVEEKTLVFLDEPEGHLHPPLIAAFVRALSELLINRNGVAIIATHSPVILQEVPSSCVWKLRRNGNEAIAERLEIESFGENIGALTSEVFGYEVTFSGFHKMLKDAVDKSNNYSRIVNGFNGELGMEARGILKALIAIKDQGERD